MTPEEFDQIDKELATEVMEWRLARYYGEGEEYYWIDNEGKHIFDEKDWSPTCNIAQAFQVVEGVYNKLNYIFWFTDEPRHFPNSEEGIKGSWTAEFSGNVQNNEVYEVIAETKEHAICLAALKALRAQEGE